MRISHRYKFVLLSKPRCASTTLRTLLDPFSDVRSDSKPPYHHHATALELHLHFEEMKWNWNDYFVFTTVRNPWEMMVSYYFFFKPDQNGIYNFEKERDGVTYQPDKLSSFDQWIRTGKSFHRILFKDGIIYRNLWVDGFSKLTLDNTVLNLDGTSLVHKIYKVEELQQSVEDLFGRLGLHDVPDVIKINKSEQFNYHDFYTNETREIISEEFRSDILYGKYTY